MTAQKWKILIWLLIAMLVLASFCIKGHYLNLLAHAFSN
jgi:hypothetical protein